MALARAFTRTIFLSSAVVALRFVTTGLPNVYRDNLAVIPTSHPPLTDALMRTLGGNGAWSKTRSESDVLKLLSLRNSTRARKRCVNETELLRYEWLPDQHEAANVDSALASAKTELSLHSPTLWVGDSILEQFYESFVDLTQQRSAHLFSKNFILVEPYSLEPVSALTFEACSKDAKKCPRGTNEFNTYHHRNTTPYPSYHRDIKYFSWGKNLTQGHFKTLLLNTGHHWWKETNSKSMGFEENVDAFAKYPKMVEGVAKFLEKEAFRGDVIFVTSPPGYPRCGPELLPNTLPNTWESRYQWQRVPPLEKHWKIAFKAFAPNVKFSVMNITHMSILRGDAHRGSDCLHFCSIGVPDEWSLYLLQYFRSFQDYIGKE
jgi:hypothetical protein